MLTDWQIITMQVVTALAFVSVVSAALSYGLLAPWWRSRTGIGFLSTKISFSLIIGLSLLGWLGVWVGFWVAVGATLLVAVTMFWGVTWNILYKQYFEHRSDDMRDKSRIHNLWNKHLWNRKRRNRIKKEEAINE